MTFSPYKTAPEVGLKQDKLAEKTEISALMWLVCRLMRPQKNKDKKATTLKILFLLYIVSQFWYKEAHGTDNFSLRLAAAAGFFPAAGTAFYLHTRRNR
jgi:apolipoprotein N-acyltransferase